MSITGVTIIRNGNLLHYPWKLCITSLLTCCDKVLVNCSPTEDGTYEDLKSFQKQNPGRIDIVQSDWDMGNTGNGSMLADEANKLLPYVETDWVMYLQADELVHEKDANYFKWITKIISPEFSQIEMLRTYFWGSLYKRYAPHEIFLGRLFRTGTHTIGGDGMYLIRNSGAVYRAADELIYHYSRMGRPDEITARIRTLDRLFHTEEEVKLMKPFDYSLENPFALILYDSIKGVHPEGVRKFYNE